MMLFVEGHTRPIIMPADVMTYSKSTPMSLVPVQSSA